MPPPFHIKPFFSLKSASVVKLVVSKISFSLQFQLNPQKISPQKASHIGIAQETGLHSPNLTIQCAWKLRNPASMNSAFPRIKTEDLIIHSMRPLVAHSGASELPHLAKTKTTAKLGLPPSTPPPRRVFFNKFISWFLGPRGFLDVLKFAVF